MVEIDLEQLLIDATCDCYRMGHKEDGSGGPWGWDLIRKHEGPCRQCALELLRRVAIECVEIDQNRDVEDVANRN